MKDGDRRVPVTLLTGFLGAGKTTLLNHLLAQPDMAHTAVMINEFGSIAVDHHLVRKVDEHVVLLESGCICCTVRSDLTRSLNELFMKALRRELPPFDRVIIETTGLADPAPVISSLMEDFFIAARFRTDGVITVVDSTHLLDQLAQHAEPVKQVAMADRLILSKCDLADAATLHAVSETLTRLNPGAQQIHARQGVVAVASLTHCGLYDASAKSSEVADWLAEEKVREARRKAPLYRLQPHPGTHDSDRHDAHVFSFALRFDTPLDWMSFGEALRTLLDTVGERILRVKGLLNIAGDAQPHVVQCVQRVMYPPARLAAWPSQPPYDDRNSRLVFIVRDLPQSMVEQAFAMFCGVRDVGAEQPASH